MEILLLAGGAPCLVALFVGPALEVHAVHGEQLDLSFFEEVGQFTDHAEVLVIICHGILSGKAEDRHAAVSVDHDAHVPVQDPAVMR